MQKIGKTKDKKIIVIDKYYSFTARPWGKKLADVRNPQTKESPEDLKKRNKKRATERTALMIANNFEEGYLDAMAEFIPWMTTIPKENINWIEIAGANFEYSKSGVPHLTLGVSLGVNAGLTTVNCFAFKSPQLPVDLKHANIENPQTIPEKFNALAKLLHDEIIYYAEVARLPPSFSLQTNFLQLYRVRAMLNLLCYLYKRFIHPRRLVWLRKEIAR